MNDEHSSSFFVRMEDSLATVVTQTILRMKVTLPPDEEDEINLLLKALNSGEKLQIENRVRFNAEGTILPGRN